jgi:hypothetical protein
MEFGRKKDRVLRVIMDKLYDMLVRQQKMNQIQIQERVIIFVGSMKKLDITSMNM